MLAQDESALEHPAWHGNTWLLETSTSPLQETFLGPYRIEQRIGAGGMGAVYRAMDTRLDRTVAIKVLSPGLAGSGVSRRRFLHEARAASALNHPNIVTLYDISSHEGRDFLVMEYVAGRTLQEMIPAGGMEFGLLVALCSQVALALGAAHAAGIVHRDVKPANILVTTQEQVKVLDFGIAKLPFNGAETRLTMQGEVIGTTAYMSPEQTRGEDVDAGTDIFSFGSLLYEVATGRQPFTGENMLALMHEINAGNPVSPGLLRPELPPEFVRLVMRCLEKNPAARPELAVEVANQLKAFAPSAKLQSGVRTAPVGTGAQPTGPQPSVAVLPFANITADKENEYFGDGLAEELINTLVRVPGLLVTGRSSSFYFRGKDIEPAEIGRRLNVMHILDGSVRRAGNRLRITVSLIKVPGGFQLWSERYDREITDIFTIQDEITASIAHALRIRLSPDASPPRRHIPDLRAYEALLEGRRQLLVLGTAAATTRGKELLTRAIDLDPEFALPYSILGAYYTRQAHTGLIPPRECLDRARSAQQEALRVDPMLPEGHAMLAVCAGMDYDWMEAERHWRLAFGHEPVSDDVRFWYGNHYLLPTGRAAEAVQTEAKVLENDPLNLLYRRLYAIALQHVGRLADAETELNKILQLDADNPAVGVLGSVCLQQGRFEEALRLTQRACPTSPWGALGGQLAALLVRTGDNSGANAIVEKLTAGPPYAVPLGLATFHAMSGDFSRAAEWAQRAIGERDPLLIATLSPWMRASPQWPSLIRLMNLEAERA